MIEQRDVRAMWDGYAEGFANDVEPSTVAMAQSLLFALRLQEATGLLEVGAGAGGLAVEARRHLPKTARHVVTDDSSAMVALAKAKLADAEVRQVDAAGLPFENASFDRVLGNLVVQLVPDPDAVLREVRRILSPGGFVGFSVWGRPDVSTMITLPERAAVELGVALPPTGRSNFHLGDREALLERVRGHGFKNPVAWYQPMIQAISSGSEFVAKLTPRLRLLSESLPAAQRDAWLTRIIELVDHEFANGRPIALEALLVVARG